MAYTQTQLNNEAENYCGQLRNRVVLQRRGLINPMSHEKMWDYPCVASVCANDYIRSRNYSRPMKPESCAPSLRVILEANGTINHAPNTNSILHVPNNKNNPLGRCAEQHAASDVLNRTAAKNRVGTINQLQFSKAYLVRDIRPIGACYICKTIFPYIKQMKL